MCLYCFRLFSKAFRVWRVHAGLHFKWFAWIFYYNYLCAMNRAWVGFAPRISGHSISVVRVFILNDLHWFYNCFVKSARRFAELCDAIFAHPVGSRSVVLLVLESKLLKFGLLVLVACFGVQGWTLFEFLWLFHCFYCVFVVWTYIFALTSYAQARSSLKNIDCA